MGLRFNCPQCGGKSKAFDRGLGEVTRCTVCGKDVEIPNDPQAVEHIPDAVPIGGDSVEQDLNGNGRSTWVSIVLWVLVLTNPLFGSMILITKYVHPKAVSTPSTLIGVFLVVSVVFVIALMRRRRWGVWGYVVVFAVIAVLSVIDMEWHAFLRVLLGMFFFFLVVKSEWEYLR